MVPKLLKLTSAGLTNHASVCIPVLWYIESRYKVMLQSIVDTMKKFIQIAKPKTRRYFIQDEILKPLFLKVCHLV